MSASIQLDHTITTTEAGTVKLQCVATGTNISGKVFAIEVLPATATRNDPIYRFSHICSPAELVEFPEDDPGDNCYFRTDDITMIFDTAKVQLPALDIIQKKIQFLVDEYNALDNAAAHTVSTNY